MTPALRNLQNHRESTILFFKLWADLGKIIIIIKILYEMERNLLTH